MALIPGTLPTATKYPNEPQALLDIFASYLSAPESKKNRPTVSEYGTVNGVVINANSSGLDELILLNHADTAATATINLPSISTSVTGQIVRIFARSAVTTLTVSAPSQTIYASVFASPDMGANSCIAYQKSASATWVRIQ